MSSSTSGVVNGGISFWYADDGLPAVREPLAGDTSADVVIVGGGYTGLWTAYYLKKAAHEQRGVLETGADRRPGGRAALRQVPPPDTHECAVTPVCEYRPNDH
ncbi:FAD-dependent oxidoreductase [Streptomyces sp. S.PNR 29]|uniref:NAD(P)-binding protein n=1 Tax=Streptomyces sp. S.PNR 29 TaxID=2973805 RepID=UPI0025B11F83|nr:FAD-dependent oxidoreductase [Streptomyces sp. S.PNR 29]MDN0194207.1 FAD-dependent oxidoreductase [Streptomyces sp. S.PNR 29]